jgi:iron complex outermembrane receptor protein
VANGLATVGFYLRGVGINDFTGTVDPSVGIYVDEVFQPTPDMLNFAVYDIERVEVLRGPRERFMGATARGGAINFLTARPTEEFEGFVRAGYGSYHTATGTAAISGPLTSTLLGRLSANVVNASGDSGYSYNRFTDNHLGKVDSKAARVQLEWKPSDDFSLRLMYNYGDSESEQALLQHVRVRAGNAGVTSPVIEGHVAEVPARICWAISTTTGVLRRSGQRRPRAPAALGRLHRDDQLEHWSRDADVDQRVCGFFEGAEPGHRRLAVHRGR